jgi:predicted nucleotidyltransferase
MRIADDLDVRVAPASVITVLKMVAYLDRPFEREKDLEDLGHLLEHYINQDDERRYSQDVLDSELDFEEVSAFLLGQDVGAVVGAVERRTVASFITRVRGNGDTAATQARMLRQGPRAWKEDPLVLLSRLRAFDLGFGG